MKDRPERQQIKFIMKNKQSSIINHQSSIINHQSSIIRVLVIEDSPTARELIVHILKGDPGIAVIGTAENGEETLRFLGREKPDIITMDIQMPGMNGFDLTRRIMHQYAIPIVLVTGLYDVQDADVVFKTMEAGALTVIQKPVSPWHGDFEAHARELIRTVRLMSEVKVVRRRENAIGPANHSTTGAAAKKEKRLFRYRIVVMAASTGGPSAYHEILSKLPRDFPLPILMVQHISRGFLKGFADWLNGVSVLPIRIASQREKAEPGNVYIAPEEHFMGIDPQGHLHLSPFGSPGDITLSASRLFASAVESYGSGTIGILLTGMGTDGAKELKEIKNREGLTIIQDRESSTVFGMPGEALKQDAARYVLSPDGIALILPRLVKSEME